MSAIAEPSTTVASWSDPIAAAPAAATRLSEREREVLRLVAAGCTDRQIAAALFLSHHTVGNHVRHILAKLHVSTRAAAVAAASGLGMR